MTNYTVSNYRDVDPVGGGLHFLRDPLDCEGLGVSVLDVDAGWEGKEHDHVESGHEEVYVVVEGAASIAVDGESVPLSQGDAVRLAPDVTRQLRAGDDGAVIVLAGAP